MYHKKPYSSDESLSEWVQDLNSQHPQQSKSSAQFGWKISKYRPKPPEIMQKDDNPEIPDVKTYETIFKKEQPMYNPVEKLKEERHEYLEKIIKMDDKIINPVNISDYEANLLKAQRSAMMTVVNILDLRIKDAEDSANE